MTRRSWPAVALLILALWGGAATSVEGATAPDRGPKLNAKSWVLIDARTGEPLAGHAVNRHLGMASTTKMMTGYLAIENLPLREKVTAGKYHPDPAESLMGLQPGQVVSVRDLLYGLFMLSGNDAAVTLAKAVSGTQKRFVKLMNQTANRLGLDDTHYDNPVGLDGPSHYTSAADLAKLGRIVMGLPRLRKIVGTREATLTSYRPPLTIETTDSFLRDTPWAQGIKTGHTLGTGYTLASDGRRKATELIGAVIGTPTEGARNGETVRLLDWGFSLYDKKVPIRVEKPVAVLPVRYEDEDLPVRAKRRVRIGVREGESLTVETDLPGEVEGPIDAGQKLGTATVRLNGDPLATVPLFAGHQVEKPSLVRKLLGNPLWIAVLLVLAVFAILAVLLLVRRRRERNARKRLQRVLRKRR
ncbi:MAG: D-alanyl-D-alanine carboxypeptidase [Solirubrobacterales bacterium]|nr:D-alanyl-D-alanine carboxypeptidase [Solirubrobacterales bacterium]